MIAAVMVGVGVTAIAGVVGAWAGEGEAVDDGVTVGGDPAPVENTDGRRS